MVLLTSKEESFDLSCKIPCDLRGQLGKTHLHLEMIDIMILLNESQMTVKFQDLTFKGQASQT